MAAEQWTELGRAVRQRRGELDLRQGDLADKGGPSRDTVRLIEEGKPRKYRAATWAQLDRALGWEEGTAAGILHNGVPESWNRHHTRTITDSVGAADLVGDSDLTVGGGASPPAEPRVMDSPRLLPLLAATFNEMRKLAPDPTPAEQGAITAVQRAMYGVLAEADLAAIPDP